MSIDKIKARMVSRIAAKDRGSMNWGRFVSSIQTADATTKAAILAMYSAGDGPALGNAIMALANSEVRSSAQAEVDSMLADDSLSVTELERAL